MIQQVLTSHSRSYAPVTAYRPYGPKRKRCRNRPTLRDRVGPTLLLQAQRGRYAANQGLYHVRCAYNPLSHPAIGPSSPKELFTTTPVECLGGTYKGLCTTSLTDPSSQTYPETEARIMSPWSVGNQEMINRPEVEPFFYQRTRMGGG